MTSIINIIPEYEPKTDWSLFRKVDLNIRDLQCVYPRGCICCGITYTPSRYSNLISSHFKTKKHKKLVLDPSNDTFCQDMNVANDINQAYEDKCKENRKLKQLNFNYKEEINMLKRQLDSKAPNLIDLDT